MSIPVKVGDKIEFHLFPDFEMEVLAVEPCAPPEDHGGTPAHDQYKIINPDGYEDWLCARDVRKVDA